MKNFIIILSYMPIIISVFLLGYLKINKMLNLGTILLVCIMIFIGLAFVFFIKYYFIWAINVSLSDVISSLLSVILPLLVLVISTATKNNHFSIRNVLFNIKNFNFPTIALLLYFEIMIIIIFVANVYKYKI